MLKLPGPSVCTLVSGAYGRSAGVQPCCFDFSFDVCEGFSKAVDIADTADKLEAAESGGLALVMALLPLMLTVDVVDEPE